MDRLEVGFQQAMKTDTLATTFGLRLRSLRQRSNRHIVSMARDLQVSTEHMELIEAGVQEPNLLLLERIALHFDMSVSELLEEL